MSRDEFWQLISRAIGKRRGKLDRAVAKLDQHLRSLPPAEIEDFARHYAELQNEANTPAILEVAFIIGCGESNDGFMDFRRWIIWQGEQEFANVSAADRESLPWQCASLGVSGVTRWAPLTVDAAS